MDDIEPTRCTEFFELSGIGDAQGWKEPTEEGTSDFVTTVRPRKKLKILNLVRKGKMVILSEWDMLKPVIFLDLG